ncbi:MAG: tetratricopeptide repeat protein [Candidatus Thermoplasmatota archaeon]
MSDSATGAKGKKGQQKHSRKIAALAAVIDAARAKLKETVQKHSGKIAALGAVIAGAAGGFGLVGLFTAALPFLGHRLVGEFAAAVGVEGLVKLGERAVTGEPLRKEDLRTLEEAQSRLMELLADSATATQNLHALCAQLLQEEQLTQHLTSDMIKSLRDDINKLSAENQEQFSEIIGKLDALQEKLEEVHEEVRRCGLVSLKEEVSSISREGLEEQHKRFDEYFLGGVPWGVIVYEIDVRREVTTKIINRLKGGNSMLLLGKSGSGKSTILKRAAYLLFLEGYNVFYNCGSIDVERAYRLLTEEEGTKVVVVDDADLRWDAIKALHECCIEHGRTDIVMLLAERTERFKHGTAGTAIKEEKLTLTRNDVKELWRSTGDVVPVRDDVMDFLLQWCGDEYILAKIYSLGYTGDSEERLEELARTRYEALRELPRNLRTPLFPIACMAAYDCALPRRVFERLGHDAADLEELARRGYVSIEDSALRGYHPVIAKRFLRCYLEGGAYDFVDCVVNRILPRLGEGEEKEADAGLCFSLGTNIAVEQEDRIEKDKKVLEVALKSLDRCLELTPDHAEAWNNKGNTLDSMDRYEDALVAYDKALAINTQLAEAWNNKGTTLHHMQRCDEALVAYDMALALNPDYVEAWNNKGTLVSNMQLHDEALAAYDKALALNPDYAAAWNNKGFMLIRMERYDEALAACDKALQLNSRYVEAWNNKTLALAHMQRCDEALAACEEALQLNPRYAEAWNNKGFTLACMERYDEALAAYDKALEFNPQLAEAWNNKGNTLAHMQRYEEALAAHDKALELNPQLTEAWYNKGNTLNQMQRYDEALAAYDKAVELNPQFAKAWNNKGLTLAHVQRYEEALAAYDRALAINHQLAEVWYNKGLTLAHVQRYEEALAAYDKALAINPQLAKGWGARGLTELSMGRYEHAAFDSACAHFLTRLGIGQERLLEPTARQFMQASDALRGTGAFHDAAILYAVMAFEKRAEVAAPLWREREKITHILARCMLYDIVGEALTEIKPAMDEERKVIEWYARSLAEKKVHEEFREYLWALVRGDARRDAAFALATLYLLVEEGVMVSP